MKTPILDFVNGYAKSDSSRFHMPGHKGRSFLGFEQFDITEIPGADVLYSAEGIIAESEANATSLFGSLHTFYSTEGSSLCIKAMLAIATAGKERPVILAARNAHKAFVHACALLDLDVKWLYPEQAANLCNCSVTKEQVEYNLDESISAVYITSPDYLGNISDIGGISEVCHRRGVPLLVDNAHGAYLRFLSPSIHPLDLGADMCCDSAHKTLPVLTGGAYLHVTKKEHADKARSALSVFASTSPSYLTLQSLDLCNHYLADDYKSKLISCIKDVDLMKTRLSDMGFCVEAAEPLKLTVNAAASGYTGEEVAALLRGQKIEAEFYDREYVVFMITPETRSTDFERLISAFELIPKKNPLEIKACRLPVGSTAEMSIRRAIFSRQRQVATTEAEGEICAAPTVSCPPAIPIVISGERITKEHIDALLCYGIKTIEVVDNS